MPEADITYSKTKVVDELHLTGGLRARRASGGWIIGPLTEMAGHSLPTAIGPFRDEEVGEVAASIDQYVLGAEERVQLEPMLVSRIWTPFHGSPIPKPRPVDAWNGIATAAHAQQDDDYYRLAKSISMSLRSAGIRIRDVSDQYNHQLIAAIHRGQKTNLKFSNLALFDLHLALHSLLSEMASTRDYLATAAARRINAPDRIDALNRLADWASKPKNAAARHDAVIRPMLEAYEKGGSDPYLYELTEFRNTYLHKEPMGLNAHSMFLSLVERDFNANRVLAIQLNIPDASNSMGTFDALKRFLPIYVNVSRLAGLIATHAPYRPETQLFKPNTAKP